MKTITVKVSNSKYWNLHKEASKKGCSINTIASAKLLGKLEKQPTPLVERIDGNAGKQPLNGSINPRDRNIVPLCLCLLRCSFHCTVGGFFLPHHWIHIKRLNVTRGDISNSTPLAELENQIPHGYQILESSNVARGDISFEAALKVLSTSPFLL